MKHNFFKIALVAAVVVTVGYGVDENQRQNLVSNIMLANVEALADDELSMVDAGHRGIMNAVYVETLILLMHILHQVEVVIIDMVVHIIN